MKKLRGYEQLGKLASTLGVDEKTVRRDTESILAKFRADPDAIERLRTEADWKRYQSGDTSDFSTEDLVILVADVRLLLRRPEGDCVPHAAAAVHTPRPSEQRAGHLERNLEMDLKAICQINDLRARRNVSPADIERLTAHVQRGDYGAFEAELRRIDASAPEHTAATELDAFATHATNPHLTAAMRAAQITADDIRKHGPKGSLATRVLPNLRELAAATDARGDRFGKGE